MLGPWMTVGAGVAVWVGVAVGVGVGVPPFLTMIVRATVSVTVVVPTRRTRRATRCAPGVVNVVVIVIEVPSSNWSSASRSHAYSRFAPVGFFVVSLSVTSSLTAGSAGVNSKDASSGV